MMGWPRLLFKGRFVYISIKTLASNKEGLSRGAQQLTDLYPSKGLFANTFAGLFNQYAEYICYLQICIYAVLEAVPY
jgi:hypothetical protein